MSAGAQAVLISETDDRERALERMFAQLSRGGSRALLVSTAEALEACGLAGIGVRLLRAAEGMLSHDPDTALLAQRLEALPSGEIDPDILEARARMNTNAVLSTRPHLRIHEAGWRNAVIDARFYRSRKGNTHVMRESRGRNDLHFVFPFVDQCGHAAGLAIPAVTQATSFLMLGVPNPALWKRILATRGDGGYVPPADIVETDPEVFGLWLRMIESPDCFASDRVAIFVGDAAVNDYRTFLCNNSWRTPPLVRMTNHRANWKPPVLDGLFWQSVSDLRGERLRRLKCQLDQRHESRDLAYWQGRFSAAMDATTCAPPLRIIGFTNRFSTVIQHSMQSLAAAFRAAGCEFDVVTQPSQSSGSVDVAGELAKKDFDLVIVVNHLRSEYENAIPRNVPFVCWIQDHMDQLCSDAAGQSLGELDLVLTHSPGLFESFYKYPPTCMIPSSNLTDPHVYCGDPVPEALRHAYKADVSFVSHGSATPEQLIVKAVAGGGAASARLQGLLEMSLENIRCGLQEKGWLRPFDLMQIMLAAEREAGHPPIPPRIRRTNVYPIIACLYDRVFRHQSLEWAATWAESRSKTLKIFGRGWEDHPTLGSYAAGEIENGFPLRCAYQAATVNLQVNGYGSLHQRLLDALSAAPQSAVLSRYNPNDFVREPFLLLKRAIESERLRNIDELILHAANDVAVANAIAQVEQLVGLPVEPASDPRRQRYNEVLLAANPIDDLLTDEGLFTALRSMRYISHRVAGDLPNFSSATFASESELHCKLNGLVDNECDCKALIAPMRENVLQHDTYDELVRKILVYFRGGH